MSEEGFALKISRRLSRKMDTSRECVINSITFIGESGIDTEGVFRKFYSGFVRIFHFFHFFYREGCLWRIEISSLTVYLTNIS